MRLNATETHGPHGLLRPWHTMPADAILAALETGPDGLADAEAGARLEHYGPNEVARKAERPWWIVLLRQIRDPLIYILLIAAAVTLALRDYLDTGVILAVVVLNSLIGFIQEMRARKAMRALEELSAPRARVVREGRTREIASQEVVPGDIVVLTSGDRVPADLRLVDVRDLDADESALTGESVPVRKTTPALEREKLVAGDQTNMAFAGTVVTRGRARGITVRTGAATELGRIATAMQEMEETLTPLQHKVHGLGKWVGLVVVALSLLVVVVGAIQQLTPEEIFLTTVALAVATIPEGLPVVLTVTLAVGVRRMARRNAIIRALPAVETLGSTTVIGSDKTGTLTKNEMTVRSIWTPDGEYEVLGEGYGLDGAIEARATAAYPAGDAGGDNPGGGASSDGAVASADPALRRTLFAGALANEADAGSLERGDPRGDPTEIALLVAAAKGGLRPSGLRERYPELDVLPFEPERRFMASLHEDTEAGDRILLMKGAPEAVLDRCERQLSGDGEAPLDAEAVRRSAAELAGRGLRVLAMAYRRGGPDRIEESELSGGFTFAGLQGMEDPVRPEAIEAVAAAREAGVRVLMLTGDHLHTAKAIGAQLGLTADGGGAIEGRDLEEMDDAELDRHLADVNVFARVAPEHKLRLVERLKAAGEIVAVTGDGVNDAPALRAAHLGVAMGKSGTDVAREASDMVLSDDNFASITAAVEEGRIVFSNIRKVTFFLLSTGVAMPITILASLFMGLPLPYLPAQILWINLVTNGLQDVALAFEPGEPGLLKRRPRPANEGIVTFVLLERLGAVGLVLAAGTLGMFWWTIESTGDVDFARTVAVTQMVVFQFFHVFNSRSLDRSILRIPPLSNRFLFVSVVLAAAAHLAVVYVPLLQTIFRTVPLGADEWMLILAVGSVVILGGEADKWRNRRMGRSIG